MVEKEFQVTLLCASGKYKPVSTIVKAKVESLESFKDKEVLKKIKIDGIKKICMNRGWDGKDLVNLNYTKSKMRLYDKEKIEKENKERYEKIKEEKYASGEWKKPKGKKKGDTKNE